ncbi:Lipoprotein LipO precursor [compost metagenome]
MRQGVIIRQDWLNNVGLSEPTTVDEFYNVLKAFKEKDPDKNGVNDTYGLMLYENVIPPDIFAWFGAPNNWKVDTSGNFIKDVETKEFREGLRFVRKLYQEDLINKNFAIVVRNEARKDLYNNKAGLSVEAFDAVVPFYYFQMEDTKNHYKMTVSPPINGKSFAGTGHFGGALISKTSVKTEKELREVLRYFNEVNSKEATAEFVRIAQENEKKPATDQFNVDDLKNLITTEAVVYPVGTTDTDILLKKRMTELAAVSVLDPSNGLISPTETEKNEQLKTILIDARAQYIMGKIDDAGYDAAIANWKKIGGDQVAKELTALHKKK